MDIKMEREKYVGKLNSQIAGMKELLNPKFQEIISGTKSEEIAKLLKKSEALRRKLVNNEFEIAVIGVEKAGKSTFANALMGNNILPSMDARCTYTSTSIRYGTEDYAEILFYTREEFSKKFTDNLAVMGIAHAENYDVSSVSLAQYQELYEQLPEEKKNFYRASVNEDVENILEHKETLLSYINAPVKIYRGTEQLESEEFKNFIQNPAYAVAVKEITIHSARLSDMQNAVLYDVPGFDSPTQIHKEQTIRMMATADVIILIANAGKPSITGPQVQIFEGECDQDGIPFNEKIFVFGNKADTANDALSKNLQVLKSQLDKFRIVRHELIDSRLVIGSARAKLEKAGKLPGTGILENLESKGINDGIDEIHARLERYNETERFEILKKRINRIYSELEECLTPELSVLSQSADMGMNIGEISGIAIDLRDNAQIQIKKELDKLHNSVPKVFAQLPLSQKFLDTISRVNSENYGVQEEERDEAENAVGTTGSNIALDEFERKLRSLKYNQIYDFFIHTIVDLAIETHSDYDEKVKTIFLNALTVTPINPYYDELVNRVEAYLKEINSESKEGYYRSLAERFSTDLMETLLRQNFGGRDRWAAYEDRKLNLYSLGIFHTEREETLSADRQPMLYAILFHDHAGQQDSETEPLYSRLLHIIFPYVPGREQQVTQEFTPVLKIVAREKKENAEAYLSEVCERRPHSSPERFLASLHNYLDTEFEDEKGRSVSDSPFPPITPEYYSERCREENLNSSNIEVVCSHINQDIDILGDLLLKAAVPAIQIDKAFVYYMIRSIENILNSLEPGPQYRFGKFVTQNTEKIACGQLADIQAEEKKRRLHREICAEIQRILSGVKSGQAET